MNMIDLRSDTVTKPSPEMRRAMAEAEVGDDVLGDDPTISRLEQKTAELLGKQAAVYMPSGTMTNQVAIRLHTEPGDEIVMDADSHTYFYEAGGPAALSGVMCRLISGTRGLFTSDQLQAALRPQNLHFPRTKLVVLENTHNRGGGTIWPLNQIAAVADVARNAGLRLHLDGARLWNASAATGIHEKEYARYFDTVSVCFSKGLGAPVGSALAGSTEAIARARRFRKIFGGGMRQVGIIAAGALYALKHNRFRLAGDHVNAERLAEGLADLPGVAIEPQNVETNILFFDTTAPAEELVAKLKARNVLVLPVGPHRIRAVTSLMVSRAMIEDALDILAGLMK